MANQSSRRSFLERLTVASVLSSGLARQVRSSSYENPIAEEDYWEVVRDQFSFTEEKIPMNAANLAPSPRLVSERVNRLMEDIDRDCSFHNRAKFKVLLEETRDKVSSHLRVSSDEVALVRNTSEANNIINNGIPLASGDEVVIWDQNHPTNNVAWDVRAARFGFRVSRVSTPSRVSDGGDLVDTFRAALTPRTKVLAITHLSNTSGLLLPVRELCDLARRRNIFVHIDGAQTWGALDINLREMGCDSYSASSHKWLVGPKEVGILFIKADRISQVWPNVVAPGWGDDEEPDVVGARKFESLGQRNDAALAALGTAIDYHRLIGPKRIEARVLKLSAFLKEGLKNLGLQLVTPEPPALSGGVCVVKVPDERRGEIVDRLYLDYGLATAPTGGLRICPHFYNTMAHLERALDGVRAIRRLIV